VRPRGFPARLRIKQRREFLQVQQGGRKHHVRHFIVFVSPRSTREPAGAPTDPSPTLVPTRLGITVTRKIGNAVERNRIKRLVREVFRLHRARLPEGLDLVWVAKQQAAQASFADVLADFEALARRSDLTRARARSTGGRSSG
jgi:ribonuclease P protein component